MNNAAGNLFSFFDNKLHTIDNNLKFSEKMILKDNQIQLSDRNSSIVVK